MRNRRLDVRLIRDGGKAVVTKIRRVGVDGRRRTVILTKICMPSWRCRVGVNGRGLDEDLHASTERHLVDVGEFVLDQDMDREEEKGNLVERRKELER